MKKIINKKFYWVTMIAVCIIMMSVFIFLISTISNNDIQKLKLIITEKNTQIQDIQNDVNSKDEIVLVKTIKELKENIVDLKKDIEDKKNKLDEKELKEICTRTQLNRLVDGLEYNTGYCDIKENLKQFKGLK